MNAEIHFFQAKKILLKGATLFISYRSVHPKVSKSDIWQQNVLRRFDVSQFNQMVPGNGVIIYTEFNKACNKFLTKFK